MKLMIAVPTTDYVHVDFMESLAGLIQKLDKDGTEYELKITGGTLVYIARGRLAQYAVNEGFTHVLWLDSDMTFGPDIAEDLLFCGKDMVCGAFVMRRPNFSPCVYSEVKRTGTLKKVTDFNRTEPFPVKGCGFAAVMTKTELLKKVYSKFGTYFRPMPHLAEDLAFCWRVNQVGGGIWCDPTVKPGHIAHMKVYAGDDLFGGMFK